MAEREQISRGVVAGRSMRAIASSLGRAPSTVSRELQLEWAPDQIATLVERHTRYVMLVRVPSKDTKTVINALIKHAHKLPRKLYKSLTWDRGKEVADHQRFSLATDIDVYFCDPQHPWQRGSNENTNGLLTTLGYYSPAEKFYECVATTDRTRNP